MSAPGLLCHSLQQQISRWADATDVLSLLKKFDISYLPLRFVAVMVLAHISYAGTRLTLMLYALRQGASQLEVGVIISLLMLVPALTSLKIGRWTDRVGFMPPALAGMALMVMGDMWAGSEPRLLYLSMASVLMGSGQILVQVAMMHVIGHSAAPGRTAQAFSVLGLGYSVSGLAGPVLAGLLIDGVGHGPTFLVMCMPTVLAFVLLRVFARGIVFPAQVHVPLSADKVKHSTSVWMHAPLRSVLIIAALLTLAWDFFIFVIPLHASKMGFSASEIGTIAGSFSMGMFTIRLGLGAIARRFSEKRIVITVLLLTSAGFMVFPFASVFREFLVLSFMLGLVIGSGMPMTMSLVHSAAPVGRTGEASGARTMIVSSSQTILPLVFGVVGSTLGIVPAFWSVALLIVGTLLVQWRRP